MGDLVFYDGSLYQADVNDPTGTPGSSADYNLVTVMGPTGATGPTGPIGLTGPTGAQGVTGATGPVGRDRTHRPRGR